MMKLIIVDDEPRHRRGLANVIAKIRPDYKINQFKNANEALDFLKENRVDIIITDIKMPILDGLAFIKNYQENKFNTKIIILSGYANFEYAQNAIGLGVFDYILKPIDLDKVKEMINKVENSIKEDEEKRLKDINMIKLRRQDLQEKLNEDKTKALFNVYIDYIKENYMKDISLEKISSRFNFNASYFSTMFKENAGMSFVKYLLKIRMENACELLIKSNKKIYEISDLVGYKDCKYFNRVFKKEMKVSPEEYRKLNRIIV